MRDRDRERALELDASLQRFVRERRSAPGIHDPRRRESLIEQLLESIRRVRYVSVIRARPLSERRTDPNDDLFDPLKAAIIRQSQGETDEAFWLTFLFVHFGQHPRGGWRYAREVYGRLGEGTRWDWAATSADPAGFRAWLHAHQSDLRRSGVPGGFGNHRKYQSLDAYSDSGTGAAVESYVKWVGPPRTHQEFMDQAVEQAEGDPHVAFDKLYRSMSAVKSFGRLARFDYLTMIGKLGLAPITPGSTYMQQASGPYRGARLLFGQVGTAKELDEWLVELDQYLHVGMQVLEDALCNWQKSPDRFVPFRG